MKKLKKGLRILGFVCLMMLAMAGIGIPIPMFPRDEENGKYKIELLKESELE